MNAEANFLQISPELQKRSDYVFVEDPKYNRIFLLDTGANRNMIDVSVLTPEERRKIDPTHKAAVSGIQQQGGLLKSLGEIEIEVPLRTKRVKLTFLVMPHRTLKYNLIGVTAILTHFLPCLQEEGDMSPLREKINKFQNEVNQAYAELPKEAEGGEVLGEEEAKAYLDTLPTPTCPPEPQQKDVIDQEWFGRLWNLFPRLQMEKQNLREDSRLPYKCKVELVEGATMFFAPQYQLSEKSAEEQARFLKDAEDKGILEKGETVCQSSSFMVARPDPNAPQRMVVDFRTLNKKTIPKDASLPRTDQLPNHASRGGIMSKLDLTKGFYHVDVDEESRPLLGIATDPGGYRFRKLPMGWINSPGVFSMSSGFVVGLANYWYNQDRIRRNLPEIPQNFLVYIDDILLVNDDEEEHKRAIYYLVYYMARFHLTTNLKKCELGKDSMKFLGKWISRHKVHCAYKHIEAIQKMPLPMTVREMRKFLGIVNFTRPFLPGIAEYQRRLNQVGAGVPRRMSNKTKVRWTHKLIQDFVKVRDMVMKAVAVSTYDRTKPLYLATDGSDFAIGGILYQLTDKKEVKPLGFFSKSLNDAQQSYGAVDKELLALEGSVKHFHYLLDGNHCTVYVDHKPLVNIINSKNCKLRFRKLRLLYLSEFDLDIQHVDGVDNEIADHLSRIKLRQIPEIEANQASDQTQEDASEDTEQFFAPIDKFTKFLNNEWLQNIRLAQSQLVNNLPSIAEWDERNKVWVMSMSSRQRPLIWVPDESIVETLIKMDHDWGHFSWKQTYQRLRRLIYWPKLRKKVKRMLDNCDVCQRVKAFKRAKLAPAEFQAPNEPFAVVHVDHLHIGNNSILPNVTELLTIIDRFTGLLLAVPVTYANSQQSVLGFFNHFISHFGVPRILVSDNGTPFKSKLWEKCMAILGIEHRTTLPYNPQCNGKVERAHRTLLTILRAQEHIDKWPVYLPFAVLAINTYFNLEKNSSPTMRAYGMQVRTPGLPIFDEAQPLKSPQYIPMGPVSMHGARWEDATWAYIKDMSRHHKLAPLLRGPYPIVEKGSRFMTLQDGSRQRKICYTQLLPAKPQVKPLKLKQTRINIRKYAYGISA